MGQVKSQTASGKVRRQLGLAGFSIGKADIRGMEDQIAPENISKDAACNDEPVPVPRKNKACGAGTLVFGKMIREPYKQFWGYVERGTPHVNDAAGDFEAFRWRRPHEEAAVLTAHHASARRLASDPAQNLVNCAENRVFHFFGERSGLSVVDHAVHRLIAAFLQDAP